VLLAGYWDTALSVGAGDLSLLALVQGTDVDEVAVAYRGTPLGLSLSAAGDGLWQWSVPGLGAGASAPGRFLLELLAIDVNGLMGTPWPYLEVKP
jgi:hypothetical protein